MNRPFPGTWRNHIPCSDICMERHADISDFSDHLRADAMRFPLRGNVPKAFGGHLNRIIARRHSKNSYNKSLCFFWRVRNTTQSEIRINGRPPGFQNS